MTAPWHLATRLLAWIRQRPAHVQADILRQRPVRYPVPDCAEDDDRTQFGMRVAPYVTVPRPRRAPR